jgi:hypothetical protein
MGDWAPLVVLAGAVAFLGGAAGWAWRARRRERARLARWAADNGWALTAAEPSLTRRWAGPPFGVGQHRRAGPVLRGRVGEREAVMFAYTFTTSGPDGSGANAHTTHRLWVVALRLPAALPRLQVTPDRAFVRAVSALGLLERDIQLESDEFNRRFRVTAADQRIAFEVLHPRLMQLLLAAPDAAWRIEGADVLSWQEGRLDPARAWARAQLLSSIVDAVPTYVWADARARNATGLRPDVR